MENPLYHVLLEGRPMGPYDRRTIVGMRIKKALTSAHVVVTAKGVRLTVADLVKVDRGDRPFQPSRSGSYSVVQALHAGALVEAEPGGFAIPSFRGEVEVRVQTKALRLAGRHRQGLAWKNDRINIPVGCIAHARARGSLADVAVRAAPGGPLQRLTLELFTPEVAAGFVETLQAAEPWPVSLPASTASTSQPRGPHPMLWAAVVGALIVVSAVLAWALARRF